MEFLGELLSGISELFVFSSLGSGNGKNDNDMGGGCALLFAMLLVIGGVGMGISSCYKKTEVSPATITQKQEDLKKKESIPHLLGRKTKDSVIDFGKGIIGK